MMCTIFFFMLYRLGGFRASRGQCKTVQIIASRLNKVAHTPVILVDHNTGFDLDTMMQPDGLHPNLAGEAFMAGVWLASLGVTNLFAMPVVGAVLGAARGMHRSTQ